MNQTQTARTVRNHNRSTAKCPLFKLSHGSGYDPRFTVERLVRTVLEKPSWSLFDLSVSYCSRATGFELEFTGQTCETVKRYSEEVSVDLPSAPCATAQVHRYKTVHCMRGGCQKQTLALNELWVCDGT